MALVKSTKIATRAKTADQDMPPDQPAAPGARPRSPAKSTQIKLSERLAAATEELASGLSEASTAAEQLRRSMEQIAAGAEEAAGASQEQLAAIHQVTRGFGTARMHAETSRRKTEAVQDVLSETAVQITATARAIERNAERQGASATIIAELGLRAEGIGEITRTVSSLSDQTNMLALNAAIEAARAGDHGRGFAVVAEEVRALAEQSDRSAREVQELAERVSAEVRAVGASIQASAQTAREESKAGALIVETLDAIRLDMNRIAEGSEDTLTATMEAEHSAAEAQRGAEQVAAAAEQQSSAAAEAQQAIFQQAQALDQGQTAAQMLSALTDRVGTQGTNADAAEQIAATAEQLSATIQELSSAASQIMAAVVQINRGSEQQAAATQQTSAALTEIEKTAKLTERNAAIADDRIRLMATAMQESRAAVDDLSQGMNTALDAARSNLAAVLRIEIMGRSIEKTVDAIALVAVQTTMLAVSGAVEAARAGDFGRGFAVVSKDIRALAQEGSNSMGSVKDMVRGILDQVSALKRDLEQFIAYAEGQLQNNTIVFATLQKLDGDITALGAAGMQIRQGAGEILSAVEETAAGAKQIATAAEEASLASRQAALAATEQAKGAEDLAAAIEEIASLADEAKTQNG
ncbi:methyl-accepting chemotaxis protein [Xanthobacter sp. DSM 24535]|uniref:methyl-accepting chemotaxis protein n=1 Tax=Roseixanthobacter psychrophilus TaxID=3119917 RepID=UPI0037296D76